MARETKSKRKLPTRPQAELNSWLAQRLTTSAWHEALSVISIGLAHDTNNCLTGILSMSDACLSQLDPKDPLRENLILVQESARKATQLIQQLMRAHHEKTGKRAYEDLNRVTSETVELLRRALRRQIELSVQLEIEPLPVYVDAVELRQVVILLALSAAQAMHGKGQIRFRTSLRREAVVLRQFHGILPRPPSVCLTIWDDAAPGDMAQRPLLLDPLTDASRHDFATQLYMAKQFVEKHEGAISLETEKGEGTTIGLWLPQTDFTEGENR